jgi:8-oxo-dGTP pyrophosphatase MutT (NUDIX family)
MVVLQESPTHPLSERSTAAVPDSIFHATDLILGTGVVIIQPSTSKIVLVTDKRERWFLPKGRKDKGESLEQTALREAYEEVNEPHSPPPTHPPLTIYLSVPHLVF